MWDHLYCSLVWDDRFSVLLVLELLPPQPVNIINKREAVKFEIFFMNRPYVVISNVK